MNKHESTEALRAYRRTAKNESQWHHYDGRCKVTLRDFRAARWTLALASPYDVATVIRNGRGRERATPRKMKPCELSYLMSSPIDAGRQDARERVHCNAKQLARKTAKYLTLAAEYAERETYARARDEPEPSYKVRLHRLTGHLFTRQSPEVVKCPSGGGYEGVAEYAREFDRLNGLVPVSVYCQSEATEELEPMAEAA